MTQDTATAAPGFEISDSAARRIATVLADEGTPDRLFRVSVSGGGCAGFQYGFDFEDTVSEDDVVFEKNGARVVVDRVSLDLVGGSTLDFVDDLMGAWFRVVNPNATSACGCGISFSL